MEKRTEGAWIIHHTKKIQDFKNANDFEDIELAGKSGLILSSLAASNEESTLNINKVDAIRNSLGVKKFELEKIKEILKDAQLIDVSSSGEISVIGITTSNILTHTAGIFGESTDDSFQKASLELSNAISDRPQNEFLIKEQISDTYKLDSKSTARLFTQAEDIGLIDYEVLEKKDKVYFNGNLFKKDSIDKTKKVLASLKQAEIDKVNELDELLNNEGCVTLDFAQNLLGKELLEKLQSISMYDFSEVSNDRHSRVFITKPSAFSKFGNPFEDDALDMAKSFIASLYYGMKISTSNRGKIRGHDMLVNTLNKLLRGGRVGPCTAIGQDYQILELNRVIQLEHSHDGLYYMTLLKYDIGRLALDVLQKGDLADHIAADTNINSSSVSEYTGPEENRMKTRMKKKLHNHVDVSELIRTMRS